MRLRDYCDNWLNRRARFGGFLENYARVGHDGRRHTWKYTLLARLHQFMICDTLSSIITCWRQWHGLNTSHLGHHPKLKNNGLAIIIFLHYYIYIHRRHAGCDNLRSQTATTSVACTLVTCTPHVHTSYVNLHSPT